MGHGRARGDEEGEGAGVVGGGYGVAGGGFFLGRAK